MKKKVIITLILLIILGGAGAGGYGALSYQSSLKPFGIKETQRFTVKPGDSITAVAEGLEKAGLIKQSLTFKAYVSRQAKTGVKVGTYDLSSGMGAKEIAKILDSGKTATRNVQILPGQTLAEIKAKFKVLSFTDDEINSALTKKYDLPVLSDKPAEQGLEGYLFPDTYKVSIDATLEDVVVGSLNQLQTSLNGIGWETTMKNLGLNKHQFVTMASIIQKEVSVPVDQKGVAGVFINRLKNKDKLGSDVTFQYAAKTFGLPNTPDQKSPYNTRAVTGLPPGPISNFNLSAAQALVTPDATDAYYFVAGDDGTTHYAKTNAEHEANVRKYCTKLCN
jgi:UPF0755 protein